MHVDIFQNEHMCVVASFTLNQRPFLEHISLRPPESHMTH